MVEKRIINDVGEYIDKNYVPERDDISMDSEIKSIFDKITLFRKTKGEEILQKSVRKKVTVKNPMQQSLPTSRKIDDLMNQVEETFSQRLLRMIDERGLTDPEVYNKAYVDRRHFSKIRKDKDYVPNKKTVLAFTLALQLSIDEAKDLLNSAGFTFSRSSKLDIIIAYCLQNKIYNMMDVNEILDAYEQPVFE